MPLDESDTSDCSPVNFTFRHSVVHNVGENKEEDAAVDNSLLVLNTNGI